MFPTRRMVPVRGRMLLMGLGATRSLYQGYEKLDPLERIGLTVRASLLALSDPYSRGDMVATVGETTGHLALQRLKTLMEANEQGRRILKERPVLNADTVDMDALARLPSNSVGGAFARTMAMHSFELGGRTRVRYVDDEELAYVMQRYRETHDILHTLVGFPVSVSGEIALKWLEMVQTELPMTALAAFAGRFRAEAGMTGRHLNEYITWAVRAGKQSELFMNVYIEECWEEPLVHFRRRHGFPLNTPTRFPSLDAIWNRNEHSRRVLINHYTDALKTLQDRKSDKEGKRAKVFQSALDYLNTLSPA